MDTLFGTPTAVGANYSQFITSYYSPRALLCVIFFFALFDYIENCSSCGAVHASPFLQSCTLVMSWVALGGLCTVWLLKAHSDREHTSKVTPPQQLILPAIQGITPVLVTICNSALALNILYGSVDGNEIQLNMATSALKIYPLLTYFLLRDTWYQSVMFAWAMGICTCFWCASYLHRPERVCEQFVYTVGTGLVLCYSYRQDQDIFNLVTELQATTKVNEELAIEAQALELRAMIGNVAHDLKTVFFCVKRIQYFQNNIQTIFTASHVLPVGCGVHERDPIILENQAGLWL